MLAAPTVHCPVFMLELCEVASEHIEGDFCQIFQNMLICVE